MTTHYLFHQIGPKRICPNFNTLDDVLTCEGELSFDGLYESVLWHLPFLQTLRGRVTHIFVSGGCIGGDNSFDKPLERGEPTISRFCTLDEIRKVADYLQCKIGYHGWSHLNCAKLTTDEEIRRELELPTFLSGLGIDSFAWPHGHFNERCIRIAREMGYKEAWSVSQGDGSQYAKRRVHVGW